LEQGGAVLQKGYQIIITIANKLSGVGGVQEGAHLLTPHALALACTRGEL
jgi:hypothetical protein